MGGGYCLVRWDWLLLINSWNSWQNYLLAPSKSLETTDSHFYLSAPTLSISVHSPQWFIQSGSMHYLVILIFIINSVFHWIDQTTWFTLSIPTNIPNSLRILGLFPVGKRHLIFCIYPLFFCLLGSDGIGRRGFGGSCSRAHRRILVSWASNNIFNRRTAVFWISAYL